jgi:hypothetical protein
LTYADIIDYITQIGISHKQIASVVVADYEEIIERERADIAYPCLWIESPEASFDGDNDSIEQKFSGSFVVLQNGDPKDVDRRQYNLETTYRIARSLALRMVYDRSRGHIRFDIRNRRLTSIASIYNDSDQGWRFDFDIIAQLPDLDCYNPAEWDSAVVPEERPSFTINRSTTSFTATVVDIPSGYSAAWVLLINNVPQSTGSFATTITMNAASADNVYLQLVCTNANNHTRIASVYADAVGVYRSVPYSFTKYQR